MIIFSSDRLASDQLDRLTGIVPAARVVSTEDIERNPKLAEAIEVCYGHPPAALWPRLSGLRWLQSTWAGMDSLLRNPAALNHSAVFTNAHIHAAPISEHLWGMCLMLTRNLHLAAKTQALHEWNSRPLATGLSSLAGRTLCVAGLGEIGRRCALIGKALGMKVIGIHRRGAAGLVEGADEIVGPEDRREAFGRSRVIMAALPHTARTVHFISRKEMEVMDGAYVLNAGRGSCIDTDALVDALRAGKVRGAGLDVTDPEPLPSEHPLWDMTNVIITPHYSGVHPGYDTEAFAVFLDNFQRYATGTPLRYVVDKVEGY
jgi:phosphoglycerate dehydrogenase-like enzyme